MIYYEKYSKINQPLLVVHITTALGQVINGHCSILCLSCDLCAHAQYVFVFCMGSEHMVFLVFKAAFCIILSVSLYVLSSH